MKRVILLLIILALLVGIKVYAMPPAIIGGSTLGGHTDYTSDANCQAAWLFVTGSCDVDSSQNSNTLTARNSATCTSGYTDLDDATEKAWDRAYAGSTGLDGMTNATFYIRWNPDDDTEQNFFICKVAGGTDSYQIGRNVANKIEFKVYHDDSNSTQHTSDGTISGGTTYCLFMIADATDDELRVYINKTLSGSGTAWADKTVNNGTATFSIGAWDAGSTIDGQVYEVAVFDRELTTTEMAEIVDYGLNGSGSW